MRKSLWSPDEDEKLRCYVATHGCGNWSDVAKHTGLHRCGKSCRLRWINYLRPDLKRGPFTAHEVRLVVNLHRTMGNSWSKIATQLPGRTDNDVKNFWHSYTRSRRIQQQQQANKSAHQSKISRGDGSPDQQAGSSSEHYHSGRSGIHEQRHIHEINNTKFAEGLVPLHSLIQPSSIKGLAGLCKNVNSLPDHGCKPTEPYHALAHTHMSSNISFDHPDHNVIAPSHDHHQSGSHVLLTDEAHLTEPHTSMQPPLSCSDDTTMSALLYKPFPPHLYNDPNCSRVSSLSIQQLPPLNQASDHSNMILAQLPGSYVSMDSMLKMKTALQTSSPSRISPLSPLVRPQHPHDLLGDYPAISFESARSLPAAMHHAAFKHEAATEIKPPEGLQSVIWSFLKGQPEAASSTSADASDDYHIAHYMASYHHQYHLNQVMKAQSPVSNFVSADHHANHTQISPDQCTNADSVSYTSPTSLQCLQAQCLADCF